MKSTITIFLMLLLSTSCLGQDDPVLRKELMLLKPLVGKTWVGEMTDPSGQRTLHMSIKYEPMYDGKVIKCFKECQELNYQSEGYYYYDSDKKEVSILMVCSNGNLTMGNVKPEDGKILQYGFTIFPDRKVEFRNLFEITPEGHLMDHFFSLKDGEWRAGHSAIYKIK